MAVFFVLAGKNVLQEPSVLPRSKSLNRNEWEEQAYQIIRRQKLRERVEKTSKVSSKKHTLSHSDKLSESSITTTLVDEVIFQICWFLQSLVRFTCRVSQ
jgi:hypothetical protein